MARLLLLDRDGVINADSPDFIKQVSEWHPLPGSLEAIAMLSRAEYAVAVVTNQSGIARGLLDEDALDSIHAEMRRRVEALGGRLAGIFHCPHDERAGCVCRKPKAGLIEQAQAALGLDPRGAPMIGDRLSDLEAARAAGCRPILISEEPESWAPKSDSPWQSVPCFPNLASAADVLIQEARD